MRDMLRILAAAAAISFRVPKKIRLCRWISRHVEIPSTVGAAEPGPLDTSRVPPMEGLLDIAVEKHVRTFTLQKSARTGGTLLCFGLMLWKIAEAPGPILWVDPSRASARQLFRRELEPFLLACQPVASQAIRTKEHWTASQCFFKGGAFLKLAGAGSPNELAGFNAEWVFINESGKVHHTTKGEAPAHLLAEARVKLFPRTSKIIEQSTPTDEFGAITTRHAKGSRRLCFLPCPHCTEKRRRELGTIQAYSPPENPAAGRSPLSYDPTLAGWQVLSFFEEEHKLPFTEDLVPLPAGEFRLEKTGAFEFGGARITEKRLNDDGEEETANIGWDYDRAETETFFRCKNGCRIDQKASLNWMLRRFRWERTNPKASRSHESAHWWAGYSPFENWGTIAKRYLLALGDAGALHDFWNNYLGREFRTVQTEVDAGDLEKLRDASPAYQLRTIPSGPKTAGFEPFMLTMTVDVQKQGSDAPFWFTIFAWGIAWDIPGWPTVGVLVDYGPAVSWDQIEELAGIVPLSAHGAGRRASSSEAAPERFNQYVWHDPKTKEARPFRVYAGLVDSGDQAQSEADVYEFCRRNRDIFSPCKGGTRGHCRGNVVYISPVDDKRLNLVWLWSDVFCQTLYRRVIKDRRLIRWLPRDIGPDFIEQLTDEHTVPRSDGKGFDWKSRRGMNHLGDCWKYQEALAGDVEVVLDAEREKRARALEVLAKLMEQPAA